MKKFLLCLLCLLSAALAAEPPRFTVVPLGVAGGNEEGNLSAYLLAPYGRAEFVCLDAGTLLHGLQRATEKGAFAGLDELAGIPPAALPGRVLSGQIKAYLLSHAHLDHLAGLVINSPDDSAKPVFGLAETLEYVQTHLFNWRIWPNFGDQGNAPLLKKYAYRALAPGEPAEIPGTALRVRAFPLSHAEPYRSTAFLLETGGVYALYLGDIGPEEVEGSGLLPALWREIAPLAREGRLRGLFVEASYPDGRPDRQLFGHLTPRWLLRELRSLAELADTPGQALRGLTVIVTHIKPDVSGQTVPRDLIRSQLAVGNDLGVRFVLAEQGQVLHF